MLEKEPLADGCVMSIADDITDEAMRLDNNNGIALLNRHEICRLLVSYLSERIGAV